jgi:hypothetical protein
MNDGCDQRRAICLAFEYRQTVHVRIEAALEECVATVEEMMCGDRRSEPTTATILLHECDARSSGDMLEHDAQRRHGIEQPLQRRQEGGLAIEDVDLSRGIQTSRHMAQMNQW